MIEKSTYLLVLNELQVTKAELQQVIFEKEELEVQLEEAKKQIIIKEEEIQRLLKIISNLEEKMKI